MALRKLTIKALPKEPVEGEAPDVQEITVEVEDGPMRFVVLKTEERMDYHEFSEMSKRLRKKLGRRVMLIACEAGSDFEIFEEVP